MLQWCGWFWMFEHISRNRKIFPGQLPGKVMFFLGLRAWVFMGFYHWVFMGDRISQLCRTCHETWEIPGKGYPADVQSRRKNPQKLVQKNVKLTPSHIYIIYNMQKRYVMGDYVHKWLKIGLRTQNMDAVSEGGLVVGGCIPLNLWPCKWWTNGTRGTIFSEVMLFHDLKTN